ncbi:MAG: 2-hydroxychromene-2-carboxylate isomerase [Rhodospirillales bacterium]|jgi:2-hydroxychromene-2-carboxylate isomerase|nr:2-hydroxychromene-2-carboxylate isomerase [Rhodospirillales bacterium]
MAAPIEFWFDFSSPYGYFGSRRIEGIADKHGRAVRWRPFLLGVLFQTTGQSPLLNQPLRGPYARRDIERTSRLYGVPFRLPDQFPFSSVAPARLFYWLDQRDPAAAVAYAKAVYARAFGEGRAVIGAEESAEIAAALGHDRGECLAALQKPEVKQRLKEINDEALSKGVFGSPFFIVDGEPFWGHDHLDQVERWMATGGW